MGRRTPRCRRSPRGLVRAGVRSIATCERRWSGMARIRPWGVSVVVPPRGLPWPRPSPAVVPPLTGLVVASRTIIPLRLASTLLQKVHNTLEVRVPEPEAASDEVPATLCDGASVDKNVELALATRCPNRVDSDTALDQGREPRDLGLVVVSSGTVDDLNLHPRLLLPGCVA